MKSAVAAIFAAHGALAADTNPMAKVLELMDDCAAKVKADGEAEAKAYKEYFDWCDDTAKNTQFEIKTHTSEKEELEASIGEETANIAASTTKIEELSAAIASDTAELKEATGIREKEAADFAKSEAELVDTVDTLERAVAILEREMAKAPGSFAQIDTSNVKMLAQALGSVLDAAAFAGADKNKVLALVQAQGDDDDSEFGAPAAAVYESKSGGIVDVLADMKDKAESELDELRKAEGNAKHNFNMLKQSLEDQIAADNTDLDQEKAAKATSEETKATAEGDLAITNKDLAAAQAELAECSSSCMQVAADHEATVAARAEELAVIAKAKKILEETTGGAVGQSYSFLQRSTMSTRADLKRSEVVTVVSNLAKQHHSAALAQLASRISAVVKYGANDGEDVFSKIKGMIGDMIAKLEKEAEEDATEKAYCDEEMAKTEAKKADLEGDLSKVTAKIDQAAATSAKRKEQVKELQAQLAALAKEQAEMDSIRSEQHADYTKAKADLELGLSGVGKALDVLRDYYGGASLIQDDTAFMQQPAKPEKHSQKTGAGQSIIGILEVCESDFSDNLAKEEMAESDAASEYEKITQENKVAKTTKDQDVKYKTQEFKSLDKEISELTGDKDTLSTELGAVNEYYSKLRERCVAKPESYEDRKARREEEINGLKEALQVLEEETAFVQRKRKGLRGHIGF
jgi:predicted  nucleic acid-binding Zn-ribbon protein